MFSKSVDIARRNLQECTTLQGIIAGTHHFVDLWARDSLFAAFGAPPAIVEKTMETFLKFQRDDGAIPYRIFRRFGFLYPNFRSVQSGGFVPDGGLMVLIVANQNKYSKKMGKIKEFYKKRYHDDLIAEWFQCEWADAVYKSGYTLFTNILYWKAMGGRAIATKVNETFWNGKFFADWYDWKRRDYFASHPNLLAIVWGLTTKDQAVGILAYAKKYCWNGWALEENYPRYPFWRIPIQNLIFGMADYHNRGCIWLQPTILYAMALKKLGYSRDAKNVLDGIAKKIIEYNGVYEVYEKNGKPVRRLFYKAEQPFAWSAGLYLWAHRNYFSK